MHKQHKENMKKFLIAMILCNFTFVFHAASSRIAPKLSILSEKVVRPFLITPQHHHEVLKGLLTMMAQPDDLRPKSFSLVTPKLDRLLVINCLTALAQQLGNNVRLLTTQTVQNQYLLTHLVKSGVSVQMLADKRHQGAFCVRGFLDSGKHDMALTTNVAFNTEELWSKRGYGEIVACPLAVDWWAKEFETLWKASEHFEPDQDRSVVPVSDI
jgi:hypothetical protein